MARIIHVKKARGKKQCQFVLTDQSSIRCGLTKQQHLVMEMDKLPHPEGFPAHQFCNSLGKCESCGKLIEEGMSYKHVSLMRRPRSSYKRLRCSGCPTWRPSEMTSSQHRSVILTIQETFDTTSIGIPTDNDWQDQLETLKSLADAAAEDATNAVDSLQESAQALEDGFGHPTAQSEELTDRASSLESSIEDLQNWEGEDWDEESDIEDWWNDQVSAVEELVFALDAG